MNKIIILLLLLVTANCFSGELHNFLEVKSAVVAGKGIHIVTDFTKCTPSKNQVFQATQIGIFTPNEMQVVDSRITTSFMHFTLNNPSFPDRPIDEFVKVAMTDDNNLTLSYQALDARDYALLADKMSISCQIDVGAKIYD